ncbi:hypothetical protein N7533_007918 [Penicillium manginii]|uniref:uncharacterized protein n=1 Tax=Penicillium manginii TaxID=203109 RepID=UPI002549A30A|nr:uncharacterized protein N7533_007918 [Penicillium manginii]KAJ5750890.1 hypothetical protein N7533_007918 [Penicillium manginii]
MPASTRRTRRTRRERSRSPAPAASPIRERLASEAIPDVGANVKLDVVLNARHYVDLRSC